MSCSIVILASPRRHRAVLDRVSGMRPVGCIEIAVYPSEAQRKFRQRVRLNQEMMQRSFDDQTLGKQSHPS